VQANKDSFGKQGDWRLLAEAVIAYIVIFNRRRPTEVCIENFFFKYSETCEIRTLLGQVKSVPKSEVLSFQGAISIENSSLEPDEVS
jgi:hypothetical protein